MANACSTEATGLIGSVFGQIGLTGQKLRGDFGKNAQTSKILSGQKGEILGSNIYGVYQEFCRGPI